jgi:hypothetical protein
MQKCRVRGRFFFFLKLSYIHLDPWDVDLVVPMGVSIAQISWFPSYTLSGRYCTIVYSIG